MTKDLIFWWTCRKSIATEGGSTLCKGSNAWNYKIEILWKKSKLWLQYILIIYITLYIYIWYNRTVISSCPYHSLGSWFIGKVIFFPPFTVKTHAWLILPLLCSDWESHGSPRAVFLSLSYLSSSAWSLASPQWFFFSCDVEVKLMESLFISIVVLGKMWHLVLAKGGVPQPKFF